MSTNEGRWKQLLLVRESLGINVRKHQRTS